MRPRTSPPAFVLGLGISGYGIVRALARMNVPVVGFSQEATEFGRFSRHAHAHRLDPDLPEKGICDLLVAAAWQCQEKPVLFATADRYAFLLARHRQRLSEHFRFHWMDEGKLTSVIDKSRMLEWCEEMRVLVPRTHVTVAREDLPRSASSFRYPCLVRPVRSFGTHFPPERKNRVVRSVTEMLDLYQREPRLLGTTLWQEIIEGEDTEIYQCTVLVRRSGDIGGLCTVQKIRQCPAGYGSMCLGRTAENAFVVSESMRVLGLLSFRGFASLEFKHRPRDKRYYFIEINPRLPWYNGLLTRAGVNLAHSAYLDLIGSHCSPPPNHASGVYWVSFSHDRRSYAEMRASNGISLWSWLRSVGRARSFAWWTVSDPWPTVASWVHSLAAGIRSAGASLRRWLDRLRHPKGAPAVSSTVEPGADRTLPNSEPLPWIDPARSPRDSSDKHPSQRH
jgi:D-aspartate ligase